MSTFRGTTKISGPVSPTSPDDLYASHMALYGQGGFRSVQTILDRDSIPTLRREEGMKVYVIENDLEYRLKGGIDNSNWEEVVFGSTGNNSDCCTRLIVPTMQEMIDIPLSEREKGLSVYIQDTDQEYRLMKGIDNTNWVLVSDPVVVATNTTNVTGTGTGTNITNENSFITNNVYENKIGCLNKPLLLDTIMGSLKSDFANYKNKDGNIVVSANDVNIFSFITENDIYWVGDSIYFKATAELDIGKITKYYIKIEEDGIETTYPLTDMLTVGHLPNFEVYGNISSMVGYITFDTYGQKNLTIWEEQDGITVKNLNKTLYIFAQNFAILDSGSSTPSDLIETTGLAFTTKNYDISVPPNSNYNIALAKVFVGTKGINTKNYNVLPNTTYMFTSDGTYTINFANLRTNFVDGEYALILTGTENGINLPKYFYGPFTIDLI